MHPYLFHESPDWLSVVSAVSSPSRRSWKPLVSGKLLLTTRSAIEDLSAGLLAVSPRDVRDAFFNKGYAGLALAHAVLESPCPGRGHLDRARSLLLRSFRYLSTHQAHFGFYDGFSGIAWVVEHLSKLGTLGISGDANSAIDDVLGILLQRRQPWVSPYDLGDGLVGLAVYLLERMPRRSARVLLARVVDRLEETSEPHGSGITWRSRPEWVTSRARAALTAGNLAYPSWNLGLANGICGVIAVLAAIHEAGISTRRVERLLKGAVAWLLEHRLPSNSQSCFPGLVRRGVTPDPARTAWCYGDPGVATALLAAARAIRAPEWEHEAISVALEAARRPPNQTGVIDGGLCHGSAGLAHVYHRLYRATGNRLFAVAARNWIKRTLAFRRPGGGIAGFFAWSRGYAPPPPWRSVPGFLRGAAGIVLALLAATDSQPPDWDRVLLLSTLHS